ncbi:cell wall-associated NlpC family hydrolase [Kitasatospora sp. MAA4]|uniref:C40 family peptidase n=1 Tax=Kitasatospora sp. MAA4 TaxID=3035093 RepID=UPI002473F497|nr:NlpC/P60 family protein [Kitasatospora sp. MAA4]MDH6132828.1 cell wall-associated NlpC family hydrolase [Kitasatospora sp. MAA4]
MRISTDPALIGFEERRGDLAEPRGCGCLHCVSRGSARRLAPAGGRAARPARLARTVRGTCLATTVLAGAGVVGLGLGSGTASAESAPSRAGWDGSKYWFQNAAGEWRYTSHYDVYLSRTSGASTAAQAPESPEPAATDGGIQQGWDGSKYWFQNASGEWRYTSHYDVYLARTSVSGRRQGWDGARYWFVNASGEWRYTSHYDVYVSRTSDTQQAQQPSASSSGVEAAVDYALAQLGKPYVWGGDGPDGYDCSGLVQQAYERAGIDLPRVADDQYAATTPVSSADLRRGDLIFWSDSSRASGIHHVAIYLGGGSYVEAPRPGRSVRISTLNRSYYPTHLGRPS